jgi:hypothetical protein
VKEDCTTHHLCDIIGRENRAEVIHKFSSRRKAGGSNAQDDTRDAIRIELRKAGDKRGTCNSPIDQTVNNKCLFLFHAPIAKLEKCRFSLTKVVSETNDFLNTFGIEDARDLLTHWVERVSFDVGWFVCLAIAEEFGEDHAITLGR